MASPAPDSPSRTVTISKHHGISLRAVTKIIKKIVGHFGYDVLKQNTSASYLDKCISLTPSDRPKGRVLLAYILEPFINESPDKLNSHTHFWESLQIARTYLSMGYCVDVIDYRNSAFVPNKRYDLFVAARSNFEKIADRLNDDCFNIVHLDTAHWMFNNQAAYARYLALQQRRGTTLKLRKIFGQTWAIERADGASLLGNAFTAETYQYAGKPIFELPVPTCRTYPFPEKKDFGNARNNYLWLGSGGLVNKGLDLVLEAFAGLSDLHLFVCGPIDTEPDFRRVYEHELYRTANIHTLGWMDVASERFMETATNCAALVYPSCAEGQAGAVATCMQAALIPVISRESGIPVHDFGVILPECSRYQIKQAVLKLSQTPPERLKVQARKAWRYARDTHSRDNYKLAYKGVAETIVGLMETARGQKASR